MRTNSEIDDALMAEAQVLGDLAEGPAVGVEAPDRMVVVGPGPLQVPLELEEPVAGGACLAEKRRIEWSHGVNRTRQHVRRQAQ